MLFPYYCKNLHVFVNFCVLELCRFCAAASFSSGGSQLRMLAQHKMLKRCLKMQAPQPVCSFNLHYDFYVCGAGNGFSTKKDMLRWTLC